MSADLYRVKVLKKKGRAVLLDVRVVYPGLDIPADKSLALMVLRENADGASALADAIGIDDMLAQAWQRKYANGFVESVEARELKSGKRGKVEIVVTDPAWVAHLDVGSVWDSRAFCVTSRYDAHAPIRPGDDDGEETQADGDAFMWVPTRVWAGHGLPKRAPVVLQVPAYGDGAYRVKDAKKGTFTAEDLRELQHRCVQIETRRKENGVLLLEGKNIHFLGCDADSCCVGGWGTALEGRIGLLELKPGARLADRLSYERVLRRIDLRLASAKVSGRRVEFQLEVPPGAPGKLLSNATDVLALMVAPLLGSSDLTRRSPLTKALRATMKRLDVDYFPDLLPKVASGIVKSFSVEAPKVELPDLDAAPQAEVKAFFSAPWPVWTVEAEVFQPAFLEHLAKPLRPTLLDYVTPPTAEPAKWSGPPLAP